ncbi:MAG: VOC family protein [Balneolales bacterium]
MKSVNPYLTFSGNTEEAFEFYQTVFGGELQIERYKDLDDNMGATGEDLNKIANVALPIGGGTTLMGNDVLESMGHSLTAGNNFYINLETESEEETERLFNDLSAGGEIEMPLQDTGWAKKFGMFADKFGIRWMVYFTES